MGLAALAIAVRPHSCLPATSRGSIRRPRSGDERPTRTPPARRRRGRTIAGLLGIALALLLVLALKAILAGAEGRLTGYIDRSGADVVVARRACARCT